MSLFDACPPGKPPATKRHAGCRHETLTHMHPVRSPAPIPQPTSLGRLMIPYENHGASPYPIGTPSPRPLTRSFMVLPLFIASNDGIAYSPTQIDINSTSLSPIINKEPPGESPHLRWDLRLFVFCGEEAKGLGKQDDQVLGFPT